VAGKEELKIRPERTSEEHVVSIVISGRDVVSGFPATAWLANFRRRCATKEWFPQSTETAALQKKSRIHFERGFAKLN